MKLRIKSDSIRYRLTRSDVSNLLTDGLIKEAVNFGDSELIYVLKNVADMQLSADFKNNTITVYMPSAMLTEFADTDKVGFEHSHGKLHILVEKDLTCLDEVDEDQSDNYPNPLALKLNHEQD